MDESFDDLSDDIVAQLFEAKFRRLHFGFRCVNAAGIEQAARANAPAQAQEIIFGIAKFIGNAAVSATEAAEIRLRAYSRNQRPISCAGVTLACGREQSFALLEFGPSGERFLDERIKRRIGFKKRE